MLDGEGDDLLGGLMLGLVDAAPMARLHPPQPRPMLPPAKNGKVPVGTVGGRP